MNDAYRRADDLLAQFSVLYQRYRTASGSNGPLMDETRGQGRVIAALAEQGEISTRDLSYILGIRQASLNELLVKLERAGYVERFPSPEDGRVKLVRLTEAGLQLRSASAERRSILECLDNDELAAFEGCLEKLNARLADEVVDEDEEKDMRSWLEGARGRIDEETFNKLILARARMFGGGRPDFRDPELFKKVARAHAEMFDDGVTDFGGGMPAPPGSEPGNRDMREGGR